MFEISFDPTPRRYDEDFFGVIVDLFDVEESHGTPAYTFNVSCNLTDSDSVHDTVARELEAEGFSVSEDISHCE